MPRERVHHGKIYYLVDQTDESLPGGKARIPFNPDVPVPKDAQLRTENSLDVSWNRAGWVQISMDVEAAKWLEYHKQHTELPDGFSSQSIFTDVLTRKEINDMIKVLRKARDQAYGVDE